VSFFDTRRFHGSDLDALTPSPELREVLTRERRAELDLKTADAAGCPSSPSTAFGPSRGSRRECIPVYIYQGQHRHSAVYRGQIQPSAPRPISPSASFASRNRSSVTASPSKSRRPRQLQSARTEVNVANLGVDLAKQEVVQARDRFQAGVANNIEVITAQDELPRQRNQIAALYRYNQSRADLAHSVGQMEPCTPSRIPPLSSVPGSSP